MTDNSLTRYTSFDHVMETACVQTITILYKYFCIWGLDLRLNNINLYQLLLIFIFSSLSSILILIIIDIIIELLNHF